MLGFRIEWLMGWRRRRAFLLNVGIPLLLLAPVALSGAPPHHAAAVYAVFFAIFGTFGSAIPLVRDAENGLLQRIVWSGADPRALLAGRVIGTATLDLIQLAPVLLLLAIATEGFDATTVLIVAASLIAANALGVWVALMGRSIAEAALLGAVLVLLLLHAGGVFRTPLPDSAWAAIEPLSPFHALHESLLGATVPRAATTPAMLPMSALAAALLLLGSVALAGTHIARKLALSQR